MKLSAKGGQAKPEYGNGDLSIKENLMKKMAIHLFLLLMFCFVVSCSAFALEPEVYIPFENSSGVFGSGSQSNPAWANISPAGLVYPYTIGPSSAPLYGTISSPGVKGDCEDMYSFGNTGQDMQGIHYDGVSSQCLSQAKSLTTTFWVRSAGNVGTEFSHSYIWDNTLISVRWRTDGRFYLNYNGIWYGGEVAASNGQWIFLALTVDSINNTIIFYQGSETTSVAMLSSEQVAIDPLPETSVPLNLNTWGDETFSSLYPGYFLDELRIYTSIADASAALDVSALEQIRQIDLKPYYKDAISADLNGDALINFLDFAILADYWLVTNIGGGCLQSDFDCDELVDVDDLQTFSEKWLGSVSAPIELYQADNLERVFPDSVDLDTFYGAPYHTPRGATVPFQFVLKSSKNEMCTLTVTDLQNPDGTPFTGTIRTYDTVDIFVEANSNGCGITEVGLIPPSSYWPHFVRMAPFHMAEPLVEASTTELEQGQYKSVVVQVDVPADAQPGLYSFTLEADNGSLTQMQFSFQVHNAVFDGDFVLHSDHWLSPQPVDLDQDNPPDWWSEEHWTLLENSGRRLFEYGNDYILTPHIYGQNPLIPMIKHANGVIEFNFTNFDRWIMTFLDMGYVGFEGAHMANRVTMQPLDYVYIYDEATGENIMLYDYSTDAIVWKNFMGYFFRELYAHLQEKGWVDIYKQHLADESIPDITEQLYAVSKANMPDVETLDAIHSWGQNPADYSPFVDIYIFSVDLIDDTQPLVLQRQANGQKNWLYYYCKPYPPKPNRHLDSHLSKSRLYPWISYLYNAEGMIFWAANRYRGADPYESSIGPVPSGSQSPGHPVGDCWNFYPSSDGLIGSMRMLAFREGLLDHFLLTQLAQYDSNKADEFVSRLVRNLVDYEYLDFSNYHDTRKLLLEELDKHVPVQ